MGKTNRTFRDRVREFEDDWNAQFRRMLRRADQPHFDAIVEHAVNFSDAGGAQNPREPLDAILVSILVAHQREIAQLRAALDDADIDVPTPGELL